MSSQVEVVFLTILVTTVLIIILAITLESQARKITMTTSPAVLRMLAVL
jgi:hypothetical protein